MSLRIWASCGVRRDSLLPLNLTVEWAGRSGHPSSYGLLTGRLSARPSIAAPDAGVAYPDSLAGAADDVRWGLPAEYRRAVAEAVAGLAEPLRITDAAHGLAGSSPYVFRVLTGLLGRMLATGVPVDDDEIWRLHDASARAALAATRPSEGTAPA
jgi:hypothetical protein